MSQEEFHSSLFPSEIDIDLSGERDGPVSRNSTKRSIGAILVDAGVISKDDAMAEGIVLQPDGGFGLADSTHYNFSDPTDSYCSLWESINGPGSWAAKPWVWVLSFKRVMP